MNSCGERKPNYSIPLPARFVDFLKDKSAKTVLDVGCGYGRVCFYMRESGYKVVGVDLCKDQVRLAQKKTKDRGTSDEVSFIVNDARRLCLPDSSFDAATMLGILTLVPRLGRGRLVNEVFRILRTTGYLFVEEFGRTWRNPVYARRYREDREIAGELGTFTVKSEAGAILHLSHHFTRSELTALFRKFRILSFEEDLFTSYYHKNWVKGYYILLQKQAE